MKNKLNLSSILVIIFFLLLFAAIIFRDDLFVLIAPEPAEISESRASSKDVAEALLKLEAISLDTSVLKMPYFKQVVVLPTFPTDSKTLANFGKTNPFLGNISIVSSPASTTITGGVIFSSQRSVNNNNSIVPVVNGRADAPDGRR